MSKIIFTSGINPEYDDIPEVRCEFPRRYLKAVTEAIGNWVIYYEPRKNGGRMSYYASAKVDSIQPHPVKPGHYYMHVTDYLEFLEPVPFREGDDYYETSLKGKDGMPNYGSLQWAVRRLPEPEFSMILKMGFGNLPLIGSTELDALDEDPADYDRSIDQQIINRPFRDKAFSKSIHVAYDETCAFTGLQLNNGKGLYEVEAAHIRAVEHFGPDSPRNGLALGHTIHWLFDNGVVSLDDDGKILLADTLVPEKVKAILNRSGYARLPESAILRPHSQFLRFHRENIFIG